MKDYLCSLAVCGHVRYRRHFAAFIAYLAILSSAAFGADKISPFGLHVAAFLVSLEKETNAQVPKGEVIAFDLGNALFPVEISRLIAFGTANLQLPEQLRQGSISIIDVHEFECTKGQEGRKAKYQNNIYGWGYTIELVSWNSEEYVLRLSSGRPWSFAVAETSGPLDRTHLCAIRLSKEFLVFGITPCSAVPLLSAKIPTDEKSSWKLTRRVAPNYPEYLRQRRIEGVVTVAVRIHPDGHIDPHTFAFRSCPHVLFGESAFAAVREWRYEYAGENLLEPVIAMVTVNYKLRGR